MSKFVTVLGKGSVITSIFYLFNFFLLIDVFSDIDSNSSIGSILQSNSSNVVFESWMVKITRKNLSICKKI